MQFVIDFIKHAVDVSALLIVAVYLIKLIINTRVKEGVKHEYAVELENYKNDKKLEIDRIMAEFDQHVAYTYNILKLNKDIEIGIHRNLLNLINDLTKSCAVYFDKNDEGEVEKKIFDLETFVLENELYLQPTLIDNIKKLIIYARPYHYNTWDNYITAKSVIMDEIKGITIP